MSTKRTTKAKAKAPSKPAPPVATITSVILRSITPGDRKELDRIRAYFGEATDSGAVARTVRRFMSLQVMCDEKSRALLKLQEQAAQFVKASRNLEAATETINDLREAWRDMPAIVQSEHMATGGHALDFDDDDDPLPYG